VARPKIGILAMRPTQFDGPFFRHAHGAGNAELQVLYLRADASSAMYDWELDRDVAWGDELFSGYDHKRPPPGGEIRWLWNELRRERYDWLIINGYATLPYLAALAIARMRGIKTALRIDSVLYNAAGWRRQVMKRTVLAMLSGFFERFFAAGSLAREYLLHFGIAPERISLFPYCVDADGIALGYRKLKPSQAALRARLGIPAAAKVILAVAKMNEREAPWDLLGALEGLDRTDLWTVLVGDGPDLAALQARVKQKNLQRILFAGYVPYAELLRCYAIADVFVHAAANEPWGVSVHEAIACGLPVVASSRVGAARDLVLQGRNGFVYAWGDAADLRARLAATIDTLAPEAVDSANREVLARWNFTRTWDGILEACT
jgi:glycosyltransferase involved in cell wall biosynthesis